MPGGRSVTMGAGQSATRNANVYQLQYGNKLQGLVPMATGYYKANYTGNEYRSRADGNDRNMVFCINQLGGIGRISNMFAPNADGAQCSKDRKHPDYPKPYPFKNNDVIVWSSTSTAAAAAGDGTVIMKYPVDKNKIEQFCKCSKYGPIRADGQRCTPVGSNLPLDDCNVTYPNDKFVIADLASMFTSSLSTDKILSEIKKYMFSINDTKGPVIDVIRKSFSASAIKDLYITTVNTDGKLIRGQTADFSNVVWNASEQEVMNYNLLIILPLRDADGFKITVNNQDVTNNTWTAALSIPKRGRYDEMKIPVFMKQLFNRFVSNNIPLLPY